MSIKFQQRANLTVIIPVKKKSWQKDNRLIKIRKRVFCLEHLLLFEQHKLSIQNHETNQLFHRLKNHLQFRGLIIHITVVQWFIFNRFNFPWNIRYFFRKLILSIHTYLIYLFVFRPFSASLHYLVELVTKIQQFGGQNNPWTKQQLADDFGFSILFLSTFKESSPQQGQNASWAQLGTFHLSNFWRPRNGTTQFSFSKLH